MLYLCVTILAIRGDSTKVTAVSIDSTTGMSRGSRELGEDEVMETL